jgi:hypothetical protein
VSACRNLNAAAGLGAFLAFKLHRFISGAGEIFTTLTGRPDGFCSKANWKTRMRPAIASIQPGSAGNAAMKSMSSPRPRTPMDFAFLPRNIDDTPIADPDGDIAGYLTPVGEGDSDYAFDGDPRSYPEDWREERNGIERLRANRKGRLPEQITVRPDGRYGPDGV